MRGGITLTTDIPKMVNIASELEFDFERGSIEFSGKRVALFHLSIYGKLVRILTESVGGEVAEAKLKEIGKNEGSKYIESKLPGAEENTSFGMRDILHLHTISGLSNPEILSLRSKAGESFYCELLLRNSFEAEAYKAYLGVSSHPVCAVQVGHLSELVSYAFGREIDFTEIECEAMGSGSCKVVGVEVSTDKLRHQTASVSLQSNHPADATATLQGPQIIGSSPHLTSVVDNAKKVAVTNAAVLMSGETGVGKGLIAQAIHFHSRRSSEPFITVNCGALPKDLVEAELFGVAKGAYTGAVQGRAGRFERANGGTLFLDELGTLPLDAQVKLLKVLEDGIIERLGDTRIRHVDVRLISATNLDLREEVRSGRFRSDLYHRLAAFPIHILPLRDRPDDIPALINYLLPRSLKNLGKKIVGISEGAINYLIKLPWEGNVRELQYRLERAIILTEENEVIKLCHVYSELDDSSPLVGQLTPAAATESDFLVNSLIRLGSMKDIEREVVCAAMKKAKGNSSRAAKLLGFTRSQMAYRLRQMDTCEPT
jgi:DNA-binding NtrC family response regulator